jgi:hypothetical protein
VDGAPPERGHRQFQRGTGIGDLPVVQRDRLDARIDRVGGETEPSGDIHTGRQRAHVDRVPAAGQIGQQCADRQQVTESGRGIGQYGRHRVPSCLTDLVDHQTRLVEAAAGVEFLAHLEVLFGQFGVAVRVAFGPGQHRA